jgi:hypothetical protein
MSSELLTSASAVAGVVGLAVSIAACLVAWRSAVYSRRGAVAAERSAEAAVRSAEAAVRSAETAEQDVQLQTLLCIVISRRPSGQLSCWMSPRLALAAPRYMSGMMALLRHTIWISSFDLSDPKKISKISSSAELPLKELPPGGYMKFYRHRAQGSSAG